MVWVPHLVAVVIWEVVWVGHVVIVFVLVLLLLCLGVVYKAVLVGRYGYVSVA